MLPALCAALMLAACADADPFSQRTSEQPVPLSNVAVPGEVTDEYGNGSDHVYFETDSASLVPEAQQVLQKQAAWLQVFPQHAVTIEGHADERGTREYNLALGERRAQAVVNYLTALGIDPKRLKTISYGKERPICTEPNEACWAQNRRGVSTLDN